MATAFAAPAIRRRLTTADFTMTLDDRGLIHVVAIGAWEPKTVDVYFLALNSMMAEARRDAGRALVLVDRRDAPVQTPETFDRIRASFPRYFRTGDRIAVVVPTTLIKLQAKRWLDPSVGNAFLSIGAAEHFLLGG